MKLNPDCIRDILIYVEENTAINKSAIFKNVLDDYYEDEELSYPSDPLSKKYDEDVLYYHINYCEKAYLIEESLIIADTIQVSDLTPYGHEFLANISDEGNWSKVKDIYTKVGSKSLDALMQISTNVITSLIKSHFVR